MGPPNPIRLEVVGRGVIGRCWWLTGIDGRVAAGGVLLVSLSIGAEQEPVFVGKREHTDLRLMIHESAW